MSKSLPTIYRKVASLNAFVHDMVICLGWYDMWVLNAKIQYLEHIFRNLEKFRNINISFFKLFSEIGIHFTCFNDNIILTRQDKLSQKKPSKSLKIYYALWLTMVSSFVIYSLKAISMFNIFPKNKRDRNFKSRISKICSFLWLCLT